MTACEERWARARWECTRAAAFEHPRGAVVVAGIGEGGVFVFGGAFFLGGDSDRAVAEIEGFAAKETAATKAKETQERPAPQPHPGHKRRASFLQRAGRRTGCLRLAAQENRAEQESSHDPSAAARKRRGPSVGMTIVFEFARWGRGCSTPPEARKTQEPIFPVRNRDAHTAQDQLLHRIAGRRGCVVRDYG